MIKYAKIFVFLFLSILWIFPLRAQNKYTIKQFSIKEGLSQSSARSIFQDQLGFIWIGTETGLNRFDGVNFLVYDKFSDGDKSIERAYVNQIIHGEEDKDEIFWLATEYGLVKFNPRTLKSKIYTHDKLDKNSISSNSINKLYLENNDRLWIITNDAGLDVLDIKNGNFRHVQLFSNNENITNFNCVYGDSTNYIWLGSNSSSIFRLNKNNLETKCFIISDYKLKKFEIFDLTKDKNGFIWLGTNQGLLCYDAINEEIVKNNDLNNLINQLPKVKINTIKIFDNYKLLIGSFSQGLGIINLKDQSIEWLQKTFKNENSISSNFILDIFIDNQNSIWLGTQAGGLNLLYKENQKFTSINNEIVREELFYSNSIYSFLDLPDQIYIGTLNGLSIFDKPGDKITKDVFKNPKIIFTGKRVSYLLKSNYKNVIWIATTSGLYAKNLRGNKSRKYFQDKRGNLLTSNYIYSLFEDDSGNLWVGTHHSGLNRIVIDKNLIENYQFDNGIPGSIGGERIYRTYQDNKGKIWICHNRGISLYNDESDSFINYPKDNSIKNSAIRCMLDIDGEKSWIGTSEGLKIFNKNNGNIEEVHDIPNLPNDWIYGIMQDEVGNLWFSTNNGLFRLIINEKKVEHFTINDGLQSNEFNLAYTQLTDGTMMWGGIKGFTMFNPKLIKENTYVPPVVIDKIILNNEELKVGDNYDENKILNSAVPYIKNIDINYEQNIFAIEYSAIEFKDRSSLNYTYKLEGFDKKWINANNRNYISYTHLEPGTYTFKTKAVNKDGFQTKKPTELKINIIPPYYKEVWFLPLVLLAIASLIFGLFIYRTKLLKIKANLLEDKINEKTKNLVKVNKNLKSEIDERKKIEKELQKAKEMYQYLVENINDVIFSTNGTCEIKYMSPTVKHILGYSENELIGKSFNKFMSIDEFNKFKNRFERLRGEKSISYDYKLTTLDGNIKWGRITEIPKFKDGKVNSSYGVIHDITTRKGLESQLLQAQKLESIGQLAAGIAHEINTPIQFIGDNLKFLQDSFTDFNEIINHFDNYIQGWSEGKREKNFINDIEKVKSELDYEFLKEEIPSAIDQSLQGVERVAEIVRAMKEFSHPGKATKVNIDINRAINNTIIVSKNVWKTVCDLKVNFNISSHVPCIENQFNQVILNMIVNSTHAIQDRIDNNEIEKGELNIETSEVNSNAIIKIKDNGGGISDEIKNKIFDPFFTTKEVGKGTGQGLAISRDIIVNKFGGNLTFTSEIGVGTTFQIVLPLSLTQ